MPVASTQVLKAAEKKAVAQAAKFAAGVALLYIFASNVDAKSVYLCVHARTA